MTLTHATYDFTCGITRVLLICCFMSILLDYAHSTSATAKILYISVFLFAGSDECRDVVCPAVVNIVCPPDSQVTVIEPRRVTDQDVVYPSDIENDGPNHFYIEKNSDELTKVLEKRSVQFTRRESIKIVPGDYVVKRSLPEDVLRELDEKRVLEEKQMKCCTSQKCVCLQNCAIPKCLDGETPIAIGDQGNGKPGHCCPNYKCEKTPDCQNGTALEWVQPCKSCRCTGNETFCHETCKEEFKSSCKSESKSNVFLNGQSWMEDSCTSCICENGNPKCHTSICQPSLCEKKIEVPGECCPVCDHNETIFCTGHENCDIACRIGYHQKSEHGSLCSICKCKQNITEVETRTPHQVVNGTEKETTPSVVVWNDQKMHELIAANKKIQDLESQMYVRNIIVGLLALILVGLIIVMFYVCSWKRGVYKTVPTSVDSNLNKLPKLV